MLTEFQEPVVWIDSESRLQPASLEWGFQRMMENGGFFSQIPDHDPAGNWSVQKFSPTLRLLTVLRSTGFID